MSTLLTPAAESPFSTEPASLEEPTPRLPTVPVSRADAARPALTSTGRRVVAWLGAGAVLLIAGAGGALAHHLDAASARTHDEQRNAALHTLDGMRRDYHAVRSRVSASELPHVRHLIVTEYRSRHRDQTITQDASSAWVAVGVGAVCVEHDLKDDGSTSSSGSARVARHGHCEP